MHTDYQVGRLRCEYLVDPEGIDERAPRLSWALLGARRGLRQTAYRVRVASSPAALAGAAPDGWDSGRVTSQQTTHVVYDGPPLRSRQVCYWLVQVWDEHDVSVTSSIGRWSMGLLEPGEWSARWIASNPETLRRDPDAITPTLTEPGTPALFRRVIEVPTDVQRAVVYASARGLIELRLDGERITEDRFAPEWTDYEKRIHYRTYDVTRWLSPGRHVFGAMLGDGWWSGYVGWQETRARYGSLENSLVVQVELERTNGERITLASDASWLCATGPVLSSDFMMGEVYDARRARPAWSTAGAATGGPGAETWLPAREVEPPTARLVAQRSEPVRVTETLRAVSVAEVAPKTFIYDFGQNLAGWLRLRVRAKAGTRLTIRHAERLSPDGRLYTENLRRARATDVYVCRGDAEEVWEPHFTFHGFQYAEISGLPAALDGDAVVACVVQSATPIAGHFECSHPGVNRLWLNGLWSQRDNFLSVPTDCPQRDERLGWMGDAQVFLRTASYNCDVAAFFTKWMQDVIDAQTPEGIFPDVAPRLREDIRFVGLDGLAGAAGWADAGVIVPWTIWRMYGDRRILERSWPAMVAWLDYLERTNPDGLRTRELGNNYGDWLCLPSDTSFRTHSPMKNLLATAYWADDAAKLARIARELGREADAQRFVAMFERVRGAFQREFVRPDGRMTVETQTAYLLALAFDLLPSELRDASATHLVENIRALGWHLSTGFIGISHLNPTLTLTGHADVAYRLLLQEEYPSWLYPVRHGATTIWERWNGWTERDGFFNPQMNSFNHYSLGSIGEWLFRHVAGIELDDDTSGFTRFVLRPSPGGGLRHADGRYTTMHGEITSHWQRDGATFRWEITVPPNTSARVYVPASAEGEVQENGEKLDHAAGVTFVRQEPECVVCDVAAGRYAFTSRWTRVD